MRYCKAKSAISSDKPILVVDLVSLFSLIPMLTRFRATRTVFYHRKSRRIFSRIAVAILSKCGWSFRPLQDTLSPINGVSPLRKLHRLLIDKIKICREEVFSKRVGKLTEISEYERARLLIYFGKCTGAELYFVTQLFILLTTKFPLKDKVAAVLLRKNIFLNVIARTYQSGNLRPFFYTSFGRGELSPRKNYFMDKLISQAKGSAIRSFAKMIILVLHSLLCKVIFLFPNSKKLIKKHKICALVFNRYATELCNCLPWGVKEADYLKNETLSFYFPSLPKAARDFYKERSDRLIEYSFNPFIDNKSIELIKTRSLFINFLLKNIWLYRNLFAWKDINRWMSRHLLDTLIHISFFEALFRVNGTKVLWVMNEDDSQTQMAAMAINRLGGVSLGATWSQAPIPEWNIQHNQHDIRFVWGDRMTKVRKDLYDNCDFFVTTGYPADRMFTREFEKARELRFSILKRYKASNVLTFFDNMSANDGGLSPETLVEIYREIFTWLEENPANFFIIKAKRAESINNNPALKEKIDDLCKKRRILILYDKAVIYPGLAADAVFEASYMTLLSLTALFGGRCIYYDIHDITGEYPLAIPNVRIISKTSEIRQAINSAIEKGCAKGYSEKPQPLTDSNIDPFVDGKAADRMREYIENLLKKFDGGSSNAEAIAFANTRHKTRWGECTVIPGPLPVKG